jgi:enhancer of polycomb-like protein
MLVIHTVFRLRNSLLHQSLETGMAFPAFTEYQDVFTSLSPTTFAAFKLPAWFTPSTSINLPRIARVVYPYWKERRIERGGLRIIPTLNVSRCRDPDCDH